MQDALQKYEYVYACVLLHTQHVRQHIIAAPKQPARCAIVIE